MIKNQSKYLQHSENEQVAHSPESHGNTQHLSSHDHKGELKENTKVLAICLFITFGFSVLEAIAGYFANSITLQTDAVHMLADAAGLLIALFASKISQRPSNINLTYGYGKMEALGALVNCIFTFMLTLGLLVEAIDRMFITKEVHGSSLFIVASIGLFINGLIAYLLNKNSHSLNTKAALIHALGDLLASAIAILAGILVIYTGYNIIDPILSLIVVFILLASTTNLTKKSALVLLAAVPESINIEDVGRDLESIENVVHVHDLHIWYISGTTISLSAHIVAKHAESWDRTLQLCQLMLKTKYNIEHITLQYEKYYNQEPKYCHI